MNATPSLMCAEIDEIPSVAMRVLAADAPLWEGLAAHLAKVPPPGVLTLSRGSSDHAAQFGAFLISRHLGIPVASLAPSMVTLYQSNLAVAHWVCMAVSQSGQSQDLIQATRRIRECGAVTMACVNTVGAPLCDAAQWVFSAHAGAERSVAATKSCVAQMLTGAKLVGQWMRALGHEHAKGYLDALAQTPQLLQQSLHLDWSAALPILTDCDRLFVLARGSGLPVAAEMALKLQECCGIHAQVFSSAEVRHGPMALAGRGFHAIVLAPPGPAQAETLSLVGLLRERGVQVLLAASAGLKYANLPIVSDETQFKSNDGGAASDFLPLLMLPAFYRMVEALARLRGFDPDRPPYLSKTTLTR